MDINSPSVPPAQTNGTSAPTGDLRTDVLALIDRKDAVEAELKALGSVLESHNVNMNTSLTTFDGFPRDDIDVATIRTTRARIIRLRNDFQELMSQIEKGLHQLHASPDFAESTPVAPQPQYQRTEIDTTPIPRVSVHAPFAKVNSVEDGSPAKEAGLKPGDHVKMFGMVHALNHERLTALSREVQANEGREIKVLVGRKEENGETEVEVSLVPRQGWGGRGMLGCHITLL
ncbi:26S proteasome non-ATPase regulatory subunit 9 [Ascodesmis nigricans]|uniref:Probable 26S proteasome regulatory subunit p27 n=1 Tax=Ascodesmis nigricans TaxID=341454 RepID=A0A4S2N357_9PEZI|nr:26S proteasome non-ATPase regulatory subunit 9 [Ascodesmis nigricans]